MLTKHDKEWLFIGRPTLNERGRAGPSEVMANVAENNRKGTICLLRKES